MTFNGGVSLTKSSPTVDWLAPRDRTSVAYNQSYGSMFSEAWVEHISKKGLVFNEFAGLTPSYNIPSDYSLHVATSLIFPVYKGFGFNAGFGDDFLNNAPAGSNKNSTQFNTGIVYTIEPR